MTIFFSGYFLLVLCLMRNVGLGRQLLEKRGFLIIYSSDCIYYISPSRENLFLQRHFQFKEKRSEWINFQRNLVFQGNNLKQYIFRLKKLKLVQKDIRFTTARAARTRYISRINHFLWYKIYLFLARRTFVIYYFLHERMCKIYEILI